jgi:DNA-binding response OmpR family regulator
MRILVVEDDISLNRLICEKLKKEHYTIDSCHLGNEAIAYIEGAEYDLIILDIMLPNMSGLEILSFIRNKNNLTPVLILTAKDSIEDKVKGLDLGADDYMVKPFAFEELSARIRVLIRRDSKQAQHIYQIADLILDDKTKTVTRNNILVSLSSKEYTLLFYLLIHKGQVLSRETLNQHIWNYDYDGNSNIIDVYIRYLRKKIDEGHAIKLIHTIRGQGYVIREE